MSLRFARGRAAFVTSAVGAAGGQRRHIPAIGLVLTGLLLSGCGTGARLYSPERDKQGQAAQTAWSKVDLKSQVAVPRENLAKTLAEQLAMEDEIWAKRKERQAGDMASTMTVAKFRTEAEKGLTRVIGEGKPGTPVAVADAYRKALGQVDAEALNLDGYLDKISFSGVKPPPCALATNPTELAAYNKAKLAGLPINKAAGYVPAIAGYAKTCADLKREKGVAAATAGGALGRALADLKIEEDDLEAQKASVEVLLISLKAAQDEYAAAEKALKRNAKTQQDVTDALAKLKRVVAKLPSSANPKGEDGAGQLSESAIAQKAFSQERIDSINKFLATYESVVKGEGAAAGSNRAAIALALFPDLQDKSKQALADAEKPNLTPLLLTKSLEQVRYDAAVKDVERRETLIALRRQLVASLGQQSAAYLEAYQESEKVPAGRLAVALTPYDEGKADATEQAKKKNAAWRGATRFLEAEGELRALEGKTRYRIYALQNEGALLYAESSVQQWDALIKPSVDLLAQYGAAGITSKDAIDLFNSLMLLGIAVGVN